MDYSRPEPADIRDVHALNLAWLTALRSAQRWPDGWEGKLRDRVLALDDASAGRLASAPFLLFSLREHDDSFWARLLREERSADLLAVCDAGGPGSSRLITAALAFLWRLCRQDPHSARLVSGAPPHWCETIAGRSLVELLDGVARYPDLPQPRLAAEPLLWTRLLDTGSSSSDRRRQVAHLAALQAVLTRQGGPGRARLAAAACRVGTVAVRSGPGKR